MLEERKYKRYVEDGPEALKADGLRDALRWGDEHPANFSRVRARLKANRREEYDRAASRDARLAEGGDAGDSEKRWPGLGAGHLAPRLRESDRDGASESVNIHPSV